MEHKWRNWQVTTQDISKSLKLAGCEQLRKKEVNFYYGTIFQLVPRWGKCAQGLYLKIMILEKERATLKVGMVSYLNFIT
jgi:hypothetical protein